MEDINDRGYYDWHNNVLNGIAYNKEKGTFLVTGKMWDLAFEVKF
jgi:glutamine cyclotransferase